MTAILVAVMLVLGAVWLALRMQRQDAPAVPGVADAQSAADRVREAEKVKAADLRLAEARKQGTLAWVNRRYGKRP